MEWNILLILHYNLKPIDMKTVREIIEKKNDLVMRMAFTLDMAEVKELMKRVKDLEREITLITQN